MLLTSEYTIEKNLEYGFYQITPTPSEEEIADYYAKEFYSSSYPQLNNSSLEIQERDKEFNDAHREDMYHMLCKLVGNNLNGIKILDFGCGWAQTLRFFSTKGADCYGCDPAIEAVQYARSQGLNVVQTKMHSVDVFNEQKFDVVLLLNVLEHLSDPVKTVIEIKSKVLRKGGVLVIEVPNDFNILQQCAVKVHKIKPWWIAPPAHLNYFSRESLTALLSRNGFSIEKIIGSFPLEMFLLFGENYIGDAELGRACHQKRVAFEINLRKHGYAKELELFYSMLADLNLGRQILAYAINL